MTAIPEIDPRTAEELARGGALLLDVREPNEWEAGHADGALHIPLGELGSRVGELDRSRRVVAICRSGGRSLRAAELLVAHGFEAVNLAGGSRAWVADGLPFVRDDGATGFVD